jgi:hypothetical protein
VWQQEQPTKGGKNSIKISKYAINYEAMEVTRP